MPNQLSKNAFGRSVSPAKTAGKLKHKKNGPPRDVVHKNLQRKVKPIALHGKSRGRWQGLGRLGAPFPSGGDAYGAL